MPTLSRNVARRSVRAFVAAVVSAIAATVLLAAVATTSVEAAGGAPPVRVPLQQWASQFCTSFAGYQTDALAARQALEAAFAKVSTKQEGAAAVAALEAAFTKTEGSAAQAAVAVAVNGIPDVDNAAKLAVEMRLTLTAASTAYAEVAKESSTLPTATKKLHDASQKLARKLGDELAPSNPHARRLEQLDKKHKVVKAIAADPTCAAVTGSAGVTVPASPSTTVP